MNSFLDLAARRQSVREYSDLPVEKEKIERCLEAARIAPSACNSQPWRFIVVDDPVKRKAVARATYSPAVSFNRFALKAPVLVVVVAEQSTLTAQVGGVLKGQRYNMIDIGIAAEHFCLQAADEGLGSCLLGWFQARKIRKLLGIPAGRKVGLVITLGYPKTDSVRRKRRKDPDAVWGYNGY